MKAARFLAGAHLRPAVSVVAAWFLLLGLSSAVGGETPATDLPPFQYKGVMLAATNLKYQPHDDVIYPTVVKMDGRTPAPLGKYYLYYAPHDVPGGICLAYANRPEGPWQEYNRNPLITNKWSPHYSVSHVSGPDAFWNTEESRLFLYFHGENNVTRLATSRDGLRFDYGGEVVSTAMFDQVSEASYGRVFEHTLTGKNNRYLMLVMGNNQGIRRIYLAWSTDGRTWQGRRDPLLDPPPGTDQVAGAIYVPWKSHHYLIFHANNSKLGFNQNYDLYVAETDAAFSHVQHLGKFLPRTFVSAENPAIMSPFLLKDDGRLYLYFNIGARLNNQIALAEAAGNGRSK